MDDDKKVTQNKQSTKGYGKRPLWQWIVLYLIIGGILYFLIYYFFFQGNSSDGGIYSY